MRKQHVTPRDRASDLVLSGHNPRSSRRLRLAAGASAVAMAVAAVEIRADDLTWNAGTGSYFTATNWTPNDVPTFGDTAFINNGGKATASGGTPVNNDNFWLGLNGGVGHFEGLDTNVGILDLLGVGFIDDAHVDPTLATHSRGSFRLVGNQQGLANGLLEVGQNPDSAMYIGTAFGDGKAEGSLELLGSLAAFNILVGSADTFDRSATGKGWMVLTNKDGALANDQVSIAGDLIIGSALLEKAFLDRASAKADGKVEIRELISANIDGSIYVGNASLNNYFSNQDAPVEAKGELLVQRVLQFEAGNSLLIGTADATEGGIGHAHSTGKVVLDGIQTASIDNSLIIGYSVAGDFAEARSTGSLFLQSVDQLSLNAALRIGYARTELNQFGQAWANGKFEWQRLGQLFGTLSEFNVGIAYSQGEGTSIANGYGEFYIDEINGAIGIISPINVGYAVAQESSEANAWGRVRIDELNTLVAANEVNVGVASASGGQNLVMPTATADGSLHLERMSVLNVAGGVNVGRAWAVGGGSGDAIARAEFTLQDINSVFLAGLNVGDVFASQRATGRTEARATLESNSNLIIGGLGLSVASLQAGDLSQAIGDGKLWINNSQNGIAIGSLLSVGVVDAADNGHAAADGKFVIDTVNNGGVTFAGPALIGVVNASDFSNYNTHAFAKIANIDGQVTFADQFLSDANKALQIGTVRGTGASSGEAWGMLRIDTLNGVLRIGGPVEVGLADLLSSASTVATGKLIVEDIIDTGVDPFALEILTGHLRVGRIVANQFSQGEAHGLMKVHNTETGGFVLGFVEAGVSLTTGQASGEATGELSFSKLGGTLQFGNTPVPDGTLLLGWAQASATSTAKARGTMYAGELNGNLGIYGNLNVGVASAMGDNSSASAAGDFHAGRIEDRLFNTGTLNVGNATALESTTANAVGTFRATMIGDELAIGATATIGGSLANGASTAQAQGTLHVSQVDATVRFGSELLIGEATGHGLSSSAAAGAATLDQITGSFTVDGDVRVGRASTTGAAEAMASGSLDISNVQFNAHVGRLDIGIASAVHSSTASSAGAFSIDSFSQGFVSDNDLRVGIAHAESLSHATGAGTFSLSNLATGGIELRTSALFGDAFADGSSSSTAISDASIRDVGVGGMWVFGQLIVGRAVAHDTATAIATGADPQLGSTFLVESMDGVFRVGTNSAAPQFTVGYSSANGAATAAAGATARITDVLSADILTMQMSIGIAESTGQGTATTHADFTLETVGSALKATDRVDIGIAMANMADPVGSPGHAASITTTTAEINGVDTISIVHDLRVGIARTQASVLTDGPVAQSMTSFKLLRSDVVGISGNMVLATAQAFGLSGEARANDMNGNNGLPPPLIEFGDIGSLQISHDVSIARNSASGSASSSSFASVVFHDIASMTMSGSFVAGQVVITSDSAESTARAVVHLQNVGNMFVGGSLLFGTTAAVNGNATASVFVEGAITDSLITVNDAMHIGRTDVQNNALATTNAVVDVFNSTLVVTDGIVIGRLQGGGTNTANIATGTLALHNSQVITGNPTLIGTTDGATQGTAGGVLSMNPSYLKTPALLLGDNAVIRMELDGLLRQIEYSAIDVTAGALVAQLNGLLEIIFTFEPLLPGTYDFDLIVTNDSNGITGTFDDVLIMGLPEGFNAFYGTTLNGMGHEVWRLRISDGDPTFVISTPEPGALLGIVGLACLGMMRRRRAA